MENKEKTIAAAKTAPTRPLCLELDDVKRDIVNVINAATKSGVPFFLLESIVNDCANQVSANARAERESAKAAYNKQLEEYRKEENPG